MGDLQIYNGLKEMRHRKDLDWFGAHAWLTYTIGRIDEYTSVEIQIYSLQGMPVDSGEFKSDDDAHDFMRKVLQGVKDGLYERMYVLD